MNRKTLSLAGLAAAGAALLAFRGTYEPDLWWHLAQGRVAASGHFVRSNLFSFVWADYSQPYTGWLGDFSMYLTWKAAGAGGIQLAMALALAATFVAMWRACRISAPPAAAMALAVIGFFIIEPRVIPRPHLASFLGFALFAWLIEQARAGRSADPLRRAIPIAALWSNFHVECLFGVAFLGAFAAGEWLRPSALSRSEAKRAIVMTAIAGAACLLNPYGVGIIRYLAENALVPSVINIAELQPPYLPNYRAFFAYAAVAAILMLWQFRRLALWEVLVCGMFATISLQHLRFTPLLYLTTAPMVAARLAKVIEAGVDGRALVATTAAAALVVSRISVAAMPQQLSIGVSALEPRAFFSPGAAEFARQNGLKGPVFNSMNLGGYVAWTLYPDTTVFQDSRLQSYPADHFRAIMGAQDENGWSALTAGVDWAIVSLPRVNELSGVGRFPRVEWATVYWDEAVQVHARRGSRFAGVIDAHEYRVLLPSTDAFSAPASDVLLAEARRNRRENPDGFTAMAILCRQKDVEACSAAQRLALRRPDLRPALQRLNPG